MQANPISRSPAPAANLEPERLRGDDHAVCAMSGSAHEEPAANGGFFVLRVRPIDPPEAVLERFWKRDPLGEGSPGLRRH
jgi:hypothetical protein